MVGVFTIIHKVMHNKKIYNNKGEELITLIEAQRLKLARVPGLKKRILTGKLKAIKIGKTWLVVKDDLKRRKSKT